MGIPVAQNAYLFAFSIHFCPSFNHLSHIFSDLCLLSSWSSIIYRSVVGGTSRPAGETVYPHITHKQPDLRVMVLLLRLTLSGVVGRVTAHDWVPHLRRQLLLEAVLFSRDISNFFLEYCKYDCEFCRTVSSCQAASTWSCLLRSWKHCTLRRWDDNDNVMMIIPSQYCRLYIIRLDNISEQSHYWWHHILPGPLAVPGRDIQLGKRLMGRGNQLQSKGGKSTDDDGCLPTDCRPVVSKDWGKLLETIDFSAFETLSWCGVGSMLMSCTCNHWTVQCPDSASQWSK